MKKKEIQNIVNEEVSKLQSIVIQEVRAYKSINEKVEFDFYYLCNQSFILDIRIIFLTVAKVFYKKGVSH